MYHRANACTTQWAPRRTSEYEQLEQVEEVETGGAAAFGRRNGTNNQLLHALFKTKVDSVGVLTFALERNLLGTSEVKWKNKGRDDGTCSRRGTEKN